jgi:hypothetical protein
LSNCGDVSLYSFSYVLQNGTAEGEEVDLIISFPPDFKLL